MQVEPEQISPTDGTVFVTTKSLNRCTIRIDAAPAILEKYICGKNLGFPFSKLQIANNNSILVRILGFYQFTLHEVNSVLLLGNFALLF